MVCRYYNGQSDPQNFGARLFLFTLPGHLSIALNASDACGQRSLQAIVMTKPLGYSSTPI